MLNDVYFSQMTNNEQSEFDVNYCNTHSELTDLLTEDHFRSVIYNLNGILNIHDTRCSTNKNKYICFPHVNKFKFNTQQDRAMELTKMYNNMNTLSLCSFNSIWNQSTPDKFINKIIILLNEIINFCSIIRFDKKCLLYYVLAVIEYAPVKGWHMHILIFDPFTTDHTKTIKLDFLNKIIIHINNFIKSREELRAKLLVNAELAKSVASVIN